MGKIVRNTQVFGALSLDTVPMTRPWSLQNGDMRRYLRGAGLVMYPKYTPCTFALGALHLIHSAASTRLRRRNSQKLRVGVVEAHDRAPLHAPM